MTAGQPPATNESPDSVNPGPPPDPHTAKDLVGFIAVLNELYEWAGRPGYKTRLEMQAKNHPNVGPGQLSGSTTHRVLTGQQDLTTMVGGPERFVRAFVTTLGTDPEPWLAVLWTLLADAAALSDPTADAATPDTSNGNPDVRSSGGSHQLLRHRRMLVIAAVLIVVTAGAITWGVLSQDEPQPPVQVDYARPEVIESSDTGLRLAVDHSSDQPGARAVLLGANSAMSSWEFAAPYRDNPDFRQLRPLGKLLMCLEVVGGSFQDRAAVQQWGCNGEPHQYWKVQPGPSGTARLTNLNSGQCLSVGGSQPQAGMQLVQRECDDRQQVQQWRISATDRRPASSQSVPITQPVVGPDPAEYPGGGRDQACEGLSPMLDPTTKPWSNQPFLIRNEDATRGKVALGPEAAGAVELLRANRHGANGVEETFYWAEGFVKFTPKQFAMALQWTTEPGPGGWHTCSVPFSTEHGRPQTVALPRDSNGDHTRDVWFRICMSYQPETSASPVVNCAGRY